MPERRVRRARLPDLPELVALEHHFSSDRISRASFRHLLTRANADVVVFSRGKRVLGNAVALYRRGSRRARLYSLVTHPKHRGKGIGGQLIRAMERLARNRGHQWIYLEVRSTNRVAIRLYAKRGYALFQQITGFYEDGSNALRLERALFR